MRVRIATWNAWGRFADYEARAELISEAVQKVKPEILCIQENWVDQADSLHERLASTLAFDHVAHGRPGAPIGNAIISKFPIRDMRIVELPGDAQDDLLGSAVLALVDTGPSLLQVATTHLDYRRWNSELRQEQVARIVNEVSSADWNVPPVICGDFNAVPESDEIRRLRGLARPYRDQTVFMDAWDFYEGSNPGITWKASRLVTDNSYHGNSRLDYIFSGYNPGSKLGELTGVGLFGYDLGNGDPSDHLGLHADICVDVAASA